MTNATPIDPRTADALRAGDVSGGALRRRHLAVATFAREIADAANAAIAERGRFVVVLAGGTSPVELYRSLCDVDTDWAHWWIVPSDERCLPLGDPDRNDTMLWEVLADHLPVSHFLTFDAQLGPDEAALLMAPRVEALGTFDLVLLGLGDDGHTASLFDQTAAADPGSVIAVTDAPKPPARRVSLGARRLSDARRVVFVTPSDRLWAIEQLLAGGPVPASAITAPVRDLVHLDG